MKQAKIEALYSQRNIHTVLHEAIRSELEGFFLNWALVAFSKIPSWMDPLVPYYESKLVRLNTLRKEFKRYPQACENLIVAIAASVLHTPKVQTIQQCTGYLQAFMPHEEHFDRVKTAGELLALCASPTGLYDIRRHGNGEPATVELNHEEVVQHQFRSAFDWINDTSFNLPMVEKPAPVSNNIQCGYKTINEPLILGNLTMHNKKQNHKAINILNGIEWVLDQDVLAEPEVPSKPLKTKEQELLFRDMVINSNRVYKILGTDPFWLCWQYDSRGRIYSHGYHVNLQAQEYKKALLNFNRMERLT